MKTAAVKIAYVTMQFPVASEAFAAVELRALRRLGAELAVLAYRSAPPDAEAMLADRGLRDLPVDHGGLGASLKALPLLVVKADDAAYLVGAIVRHCWRQPIHLVKALALVPRSLQLLQRLEELKPEVVHLFWGHYPSLVGLLAVRRLPHVVISQFLGAYDLEGQFPLSDVLARRADLVFTHARANLPAVAALGLAKERIQASHRGIEISTPPPAPAKTRGLMVVAERLVHQKRTADALQVFAAVSREIPDARLLVLGAGPEADALRSLAGRLGIAGRVTFTGHVPHGEVQRHLAEAEVALTMSQSPSERLPNVLKEAMLQRCLCLATRSTGIEELIADGETGLLVDFGDVAGAARRLVEMLNDRDARARIVRQAQDRILAEFDVDRLMAERMDQWRAQRKVKAA